MRSHTWPIRLLLQGAVLLCVGTLLATTAHAQFVNINTAPTLTLNPSDPSPQETVTVSLDAYALDMTGATTRWYVDGREQPDSQNARSLQTTVGNFGSETTISATITLRSGETANVKRTISPSSVDLIIEPDALTPPFYRGRALPVGGELVRAVAIPHISGYTDPDALTYTWTLGSQVLFNGPQRGINQVDFTMPKRATTLSVVVTNNAGVRLGAKTISLTPAQPELHFYEANPLRGMSERAIQSPYVLIGDEATVHASIYNISREIFSLNPVFSWSINGAPTQNYGAEPQTITLRSTGGNGQANVGFELMNRQAFTQFVQGTFTILFQSDS